MNDRARAEDDPIGPHEPILADLVDRITSRLQAGQPVGLEELLHHNPACSGPIRRLLPTLYDLTGTRRAAASAGDAREPSPRSELPE